MIMDTLYNNLEASYNKLENYTSIVRWNNNKDCFKMYRCVVR